MAQHEIDTVFTKFFFFLQKLHEKALKMSGTKHVELMETLTHRQAQAFFIIGSLKKEYPEGMRIPELAGYVQLSSSMTSTVINEMIGKDLLAWVGHPEDRRVIRVTLSVLGTTIFQLFNEKIVEISERKLNELPEELRNNFIEAVHLLCHDFGE